MMVDRSKGREEEADKRENKEISVEERASRRLNGNPTVVEGFDRDLFAQEATQRDKEIRVGK